MKSTSIALTTFIALLTMFATMCASPAHADQAAVTFLQPYVQWAETKPLGQGIYDLDFTLVSNQPSLTASFASGALEFEEYETDIKGHWYPTKQFTTIPGQDAGQYFSDRLWNSQPNTLFGFWHPFNPFQTDQLRITLDAINGQLIYYRDSWGGTAFSADLHVLPNSNVLAGTLTIQKQPVTVLISVKEDFRQIPKQEENVSTVIGAEGCETDREVPAHLPNRLSTMSAQRAVLSMRTTAPSMRARAAPMWSCI